MWQLPPFVIYCIFFLDFFVAFFFLIIFIKAKFRVNEHKAKEFEITFIIPAFNCEKIIEKTIESIKKARYNQNKIKIIIVNDGSTDNTLNVISKLAEKYKGIKVFSKKNSGKADSLNFGIKKAGTELVAVLDADTLLREDLIEKTMPLFSENTAAVTSRLKPINNSRLIEKLQDVEYTFSGFYRLMIGNLNSLPVAPAFTVFRRKFFLDYGYFDKDNLTEDLEMGLRIQSEHYNVGYATSSYAMTEVPDTFKKLLKQRLRWGYGTLYNYNKYRRLFFNRRYGDLGFFVLPTAFLSILVISLVFLFGIYTIFSWIVEHLQMLSVGWLFTLEFNASQILIYMTDLKIILFAFAVVLGLASFFLVNYELKEKLKIRYYFLYFTVYLWTLAIFYIISLFYFIIKKKPKW